MPRGALTLALLLWSFCAGAQEPVAPAANAQPEPVTRPDDPPVEAAAATAASAAAPEAAPEPASEPLPTAAADAAAATPDPATAAASDDSAPASSAPVEAVVDPSFVLLGRRIAPGTRARVAWRSGATFIGEPMEVPISVVHGIKPGPVLCLTGAIHGDELNGVEVIRRVIGALDASELVGTVVGVPIVNLAGFSRGSRYLPDRRDLNRFFPGNPSGSSASRIAHDFFENVARRCGAIVDFHTGSFDRSNLPQVRGDLRLSAVVELTRGFGATSVLHTPGAPGMLRRAATDAGIPAVTFEVGAPVRLEPVEIEHGVTAIETLMNNLGMTQRVRQWREPQPIFYESRWVRATRPGMFFSDVKLGDRVRQGQRLGRVINPLTDEASELVAPVRGRVLGMALNQVVLPGYAAFHVGEEASEAQVIRDAASLPVPTDETESMDEGAPATPEEGSTEQVEDYGSEDGGSGG